MITPRFSCSQTEKVVIVSVYCPSIRAADVEINVDCTLVTIHVNPYFLRLNFSKPLLEDDDSSANYDPSSGTLIISLTKENPGEVFDDLDLLSKLLAPRRTADKMPPSIEVIASDTTAEDELVSQTESLSLSKEQQELIEAEENDWQLPQQVPQGLPLLNLSKQQHYGFLSMHSGYLRHVLHTENEVNELGGDAEECTTQERTSKRIAHEDAKFDEEHYIADFMDDEFIQELIHWTHPHVYDVTSITYTAKENMEMLRLPRKEYIATSVQTHNLYLTLVTLLFSYAYDSRTSQYDPTLESAWTMCNLTPAFSALDSPHSRHYSDGPQKFEVEELQEALVTSYRRSLIFPLYRSFALAERCQKDVAAILQKGKRMVMRCLLEMKGVLDHHEVYYIYSKIWVDDFCVWIQADADDDVLKALGQVLMTTKLDKSSLGLDLEILETAALQAGQREPDSDDESEDSDDTLLSRN